MVHFYSTGSLVWRCLADSIIVEPGIIISCDKLSSTFEVLCSDKIEVSKKTMIHQTKEDAEAWSLLILQEFRGLNFDSLELRDS